MSKSEHTPGPWDCVGQTVFALDETRTCNRFSCNVQGGFVERAQGWHVGERTSDSELEANARLIAAAPELLEGAMDTVEALKLLRIGMAHEPKAIEVIDAHIDELEYAIAKARGA